jgi:hypothetical protein
VIVYIGFAGVDEVWVRIGRSHSSERTNTLIPVVRIALVPLKGTGGATSGHGGTCEIYLGDSSDCRRREAPLSLPQRQGKAFLCADEADTWYLLLNIC